MKRAFNNKFSYITVLGSILVMTVSCTHSVSYGITDTGHVETSDLVFPELDSAWEKNGQFPNLENLTKIKSGITKDELYYLLDRPHFKEAQHAREWDYILKFYEKDDSVKVCQYKVIFDKEFKGQEFYWLPADCAKYAQLQNAQAVPQVVQPSTPVLRREKITLDADALFKFDKSDLANMLPQGRIKLDELADKLRAYSKEGEVRIALIGHTDNKGSKDYNYQLSQRRANTVLAYLAQQGVNPATMSATGVGEDFPVKQCPTNLSHQHAIECLQPNRRVEAHVIIYQFAE